MDKLHEEIAKVAYELFEKRGRSEGRHLDDWLEAEKIVRERHARAEIGKEKPTKAAAVKRTSVRAPRKKEPAAGDKALPKKTTARKTSASRKAT